MDNVIDDTEAMRIALEHVGKQELGAQASVQSIERQNIWLMEVAWPALNEKGRGTQFAKMVVSGSGEVKEYEKTRFRNDSLKQRILSKLRQSFFHHQPANPEGQAVPLVAQSSEQRVESEEQQANI